MEKITDPVDDILAAHGMKGPWKRLTATGLANRIYATKDLVIRVAREHDEALRDARTESIAAPVAYAAGLVTPRMLVFDESGEIFERPYSIWERVHGETLGLISADPHSMPNTWRQIGYQMALLHNSVKPFEDSKNYLHTPTRALKLDLLLDELVTSEDLGLEIAEQVFKLIAELHLAVLEESKTCFLHSDVKDMNIMCTHNDEFLALIDWGDAGWGDPTFDFRQIPLTAMPYVLESYREAAPDMLGNTFKERFVWDKLSDLLGTVLVNPSITIPIDEFRAFLNDEIAD